MKLLTAALIGSSALTAFATGFRLPDQDAFATARGEAFVATADNPSAIYYNPAGIAFLQGHNLRGGAYVIDLEPTFEPATGGKFENKDNWHGIPQFFYTYSHEKCPVSFGVGAYAPYGLGVEWPQDTGFRTLGTEGSLSYFTVNPVVAWKVNDSLSVAAGLTFNYASVDLRQGLVWPTQPFDEFRFKGCGWDFGYNAGVLWKAHEKLQFGGVFRSATKITMDGQTEAQNMVPLPSPPSPFPVPGFAASSGAEAAFDFPFAFCVGVSYRPTPKWNLEFNAEYTDWNSVNTVTIRQATGVPGLIPQNVPLVLNWESSWYYEFGVTRYFDNGWHVSGGYIFNENSLPDANYQPLVADQDRHFFSVGTGCRGKRMSFDVAYQFGYGPERTVSGSAPSATGQTADGDYGFISHAISVSVGWHF